MKQKNLFKLIAMSLVLVMLVSGLASCSTTAKLKRMEEPERAMELYRLVEEAEKALDSYTVDLTASISMTVEGEMLTSTVTGSMMLEGLQGDSMSYISSARTELKFDGETTVIESTEGYQDGKMFLTNKTEDAEQKLWSPITQADYNAHQEAMQDDQMDFDITAENCTEKTCVLQEDKSWVATYSGFTDEALEQFIDLISGMDDFFGDDFRIADVMLKMTATETFAPKALELTFVIEKTEDADADTELPVISFGGTYKDIGTTKATRIDFSDYTETADLRQLDIAEKALDARLEAEEGMFRYSYLQSATAGVLYDETTDEVDTVTYSLKNDKVSYTLTGESESSDIEYTIEYKDGKKKTSEKKSGTQNTENSDDETERSFLMSCLNPAGFSASDIVDIEVFDAENGVWKFSLGESYAEEYAEEMKDFEAYYLMTIKDGKLTEKQFCMSFKMTESGITVSYTQELSCTYIDE